MTTPRLKVWAVPPARLWHLLMLVATVACGLTIYRRHFDRTPQSLRAARFGGVEERREAVASLVVLHRASRRPEAFQAMMRALDDEDPTVRSEALQALGVVIGDEAPLPSYPGPALLIDAGQVDAAKAGLVAALGDSDPGPRVSAAIGLSHAGDRSAAVLDRLVGECHAARPTIDPTQPLPGRRRLYGAIQTLASHHHADPRAASTLLDVAARADPRVRELAVPGLALWCNLEKGPMPRPFRVAWLALLRDPSTRVRLATLGCMRTWGARQAGRASFTLPTLVRLLRDDHYANRTAAVGALSLFGSLARPALPALWLASGDPDQEVGSVASLVIDSIRQFGLSSRTRLQYLRPELRAPQPARRLRAVDGLEALGWGAYPASMDLCRALLDPDARVRRRAAEVLASLAELVPIVVATHRESLRCLLRSGVGPAAINFGRALLGPNIQAHDRAGEVLGALAEMVPVVVATGRQSILCFLAPP